MKQKKLRILSLILMVAIVTAFFPERPKNSAAAAKKLTAITAAYTGGSVLVGHTIDLTKLTVMGVYDNGDVGKLTDYTLSSYTVGFVGGNSITVTSGGIRTQFNVEGKKLSMLNAFYKEGEATLGTLLDLSKVVVSASFSDGSSSLVEDFFISSKLVSTVGENEYMVTYEGMSTKFRVYGREVKVVKDLVVQYSGPAVIVGNAPKLEDFYVTAIYNDNSIEKVVGFELTPAIIQKEGMNTMVATYGGISKEVKVAGSPKQVVSIKAEYIGFPIVLGQAVSMEDVEVTATYNDGKTEKVKNFSLSNSVIYLIGDNLISVSCENANTFVTVRGVEAEIIDYGHAAQETVSEGSYLSRITVAVGEKADPKNVAITPVKANLVKKAMNRLVRTEKYLAFEVSFDDPELDRFLPMTVKVSVPPEFRGENFAVLYTPNRRTIMASMNGEFLKDGSYEFKMFQPGTYIIADCTEQVYVESISMDISNLTLKTGRSFSLSPAVYPLAATNQELSYSSSRPQIATVTENGLVTAESVGTTVITIAAKDGSGKQFRLLVHVKNK